MNSCHTLGESTALATAPEIRWESALSCIANAVPAPHKNEDNTAQRVDGEA